MGAGITIWIIGTLFTCGVMRSNKKNRPDCFLFILPTVMAWPLILGLIVGKILDKHYGGDE